MAYTKLHQSLVTSTIWREPNATRLVWVTMMAMADKNGEVMASIPGLADLARVTIEECEIALQTFLSPDKYSRTKTAEGRRIQEIEGGWFLINHPQYREMASREDATKKASERMARYRRNKALQGVTVTKNLHIAEAEAESREQKAVSPVPTREESGMVEPPMGFPKSEAEAVASAEMAGVPGDFASTEYNRLLGRGFRDAKGVLITNWRGFIKACHSTSISINAEKNGNRKKLVNGISASMQASLDKTELERIEAEISRTLNSYEAHQSLSTEDREKLNPLRARRSELKTKLGFKV